MPRAYTPDGNYAQNLAYRALCAELRGRRTKKRRRREAPVPRPFSPPDMKTGKWDVNVVPCSHYWQRREHGKKSYAKSRWAA